MTTASAGNDSDATNAAWAEAARRYLALNGRDRERYMASLTADQQAQLAKVIDGLSVGGHSAGSAPLALSFDVEEARLSKLSTHWGVLGRSIFRLLKRHVPFSEAVGMPDRLKLRLLGLEGWIGYGHDLSTGYVLFGAANESGHYLVLEQVRFSVDGKLLQPYEHLDINNPSDVEELLKKVFETYLPALARTNFGIGNPGQEL